MIDFPIDELLDDSICLLWLERHLHPTGFTCPHCSSPSRRMFRAQGHFPAYRCRACAGYDTLLTRTVFAKTRQRPATLVLLLRGMAKGEPTARLARELGISRKQLHTLRQRIQVVTARGEQARQAAQDQESRGPGREIGHPAHGATVARFTAGVWGVAHHIHALATLGRAGCVVEYPDGAEAPEAD